MHGPELLLLVTALATLWLSMKRTLAGWEEWLLWALIGGCILGGAGLLAAASV